MEQDTEDSPTRNGVPFKVVDLTREKRKGVVAASLQDLISRGKFHAYLWKYVQYYYASND